MLKIDFKSKQKYSKYSFHLGYIHFIYFSKQYFINEISYERGKYKCTKLN